MESRGMRGAAIVLVVALLWSGASAGGITIYWGQSGPNGNEPSFKEASLADTCASGNFEIVIVAFLTTVGNGQNPVLNLANHCDPPSGTCKSLSADIKSCQSKGVKVFLSLGGQNSNINIISEDNAKDVAAYLWSSYLGGTSSDRPLGDAVLDGIDFDIEYAAGHLDYLARALSAYSNSSKKVYLSAAPQCPYDINNYLETALKTSLFDYVWIQFYNNPPCNANGDSSKVVDAWKKWTESVTTVLTRGFYLGLPAAPGAAGSGYIEPHTLISDVLPHIKDSSKYGGVMLWNKYWDQQTGYSSSIKDHVIMKPSLVDVPTLASV